MGCDGLDTWKRDNFFSLNNLLEMVDAQARTLSARYIMKCDDDTFVRLDAVINEVEKVSEGRSFYIGNINYFHKPLRHGKWAVTYEVYSSGLE